MILFTKEDASYGWLSNFSPFTVLVGTRLFRTAEHLFQASKFWHNPAQVEQILRCGTPSAAKKLGRMPGLDLQWNAGSGFAQKKVRVMVRILTLKVEQHPELARRLLATGFEELVEYAPWGDRFWGVDKNRQGENWLGKCWMKVRDNLRDESV
jgi:ribA/ribD-fused uncharacterized protein